MSVEVEIEAAGAVRVMRVTMSRVPSVGEVVRVLQTVDYQTTAAWLMVVRVTHNANTEEYPRRKNELDAWVSCEAISPQW